MEKIKIKDDYIKLGQALKLAGLVSSGIDAKFVVQDGQVKVNGEVDTRRGKKLVPGDNFEFDIVGRFSIDYKSGKAAQVIVEDWMFYKSDKVQGFFG